MARLNVVAVVALLLWIALGAWGIETLIQRYPTVGGYMLPFVFAAWLLVPYVIKWVVRGERRLAQIKTITTFEASRIPTAVKVVRLTQSQADEMIRIVSSKHFAIPHTNIVLATAAYELMKVDEEPTGRETISVERLRSASRMVWAH